MKPKDIYRDREFVRSVDISGIKVDDIFDDSNIETKIRLLREKGITNLYVAKQPDGSTRVPIERCTYVRVNKAFQNNYNQSLKNIENFKQEKPVLTDDRSDVTLEQHLMALDGGWAWAKKVLPAPEFQQYLDAQYEMLK
jgi:hypothetical protein